MLLDKISINCNRGGWLGLVSYSTFEYLSSILKAKWLTFYCTVHPFAEEVNAIIPQN